MKKQTIRGLALIAASALLFAGCAKENPDTPSRSDGKMRINFAAPGIEQEVAPSTASAPKSALASRAAVPLTERTTVRVVALTKTATPYSADQAYYVDGGKLKPCTVNADGSFKAVDTENELALYPGDYDLYAYTPAVELGASKNSVTVPNGVDYASSVTAVKVSADMTKTLTTLDRKCSKIALVVTKGADNPTLTAISIGAGGVTINNLPPTVTNLGLNQPIAQASGSAVLNVANTAFKTESATKISAITYILPRLGTDRINLKYNLTYTVSGTSETKDISGSMGNVALESGKSYIFTLTMRKAGASLAVSDWIDQPQDVVEGEEFDYSIDGSAWFLLSSGDMKHPTTGATTMNWYVANGVYHATHNPTTLKACPTGWRMPTLMELHLLWIYNSIIPAKFSLGTVGYWSSTEFSVGGGSCGYLDFNNGLGNYGSGSNSLNVRCVRDFTPPIK